MDPHPLPSAMTDKFCFGAHQFLWKSHWTDGDLGILDAARNAGCTIFEISLGDDVKFNSGLLRRHAENLGMELTVGPGNAWPKNCNISDDDPRHRQLGMAWHKKIIEWGAEFGAVAYCGSFYSHPGYLCCRRPPEEELRWTAENLHELAEFAGRLGVRLVIEPMSRFRLHLVNTSVQAVKLVTLADHANLRINLDTYHMITEERNYGAAVRHALPILWGIHACENDRGVPGGGLVPWSDVFGALADAPGCVRVMLETYNTGSGDFGISRGIFQDLCPDPDAFVRQGLAFLKGCAASSVGHVA